MIQCPHCQSSQRQNKAGFTRFGSQRHFCSACQRTYTPEPKHHGCSNELRQEVVRYSLEGIPQRKVARLLRVSPASVANWLALAGERLEALGVPEVPAELLEFAGDILEQDELFTFCHAKAKKPRLSPEEKTEAKVGTIEAKSSVKPTATAQKKTKNIRRVRST